MDYVIMYNEELYLSDITMDSEFNRIVQKTQWSSDIRDAMRFVPEYAAVLAEDIIEAQQLDPDMVGYFSATTDCNTYDLKHYVQQDFDEE